MLAANPTKYGQPCTLSSAEALAAALFVAGFAEDARTLMARFHWGDSFWQLNGRFLEAYAACADAQAVLTQQARFMAEISDERAQRAARDGTDDMPSSSSSGSERSGEEGSPTSGSDEPCGARPRAFRVRNPNAGWRGGGGGESDESSSSSGGSSGGGDDGSGDERSSEASDGAGEAQRVRDATAAAARARLDQT